MAPTGQKPKLSKEVNKRNAYIKSALRKIWRWSGERRFALMGAFDKQRKRFMCAGCHKLYRREDVYVDHVHPVVNPETGFTGWDTYITRMWPGVPGYQVLCEACHTAKTKAERETRKRRNK